MLAREDKSWREHWHPIDQLWHSVGVARDSRHVGEIEWRRVIMAATVLTVIIPTAIAAMLIIVEVTAGFRARLASLVGLHAAADGLGRDALADFDIRLLDDHSALDGLPSAAAVFSAQHPLPVGVGELGDRDDADARLVIAAVTWTEANAPSGLAGC